MSDAASAVRDGWKLRRNPTWNKRIRKWVRELVAERSYSSPERVFRCYHPVPVIPQGAAVEVAERIIVLLSGGRELYFYKWWMWSALYSTSRADARVFADEEEAEGALYDLNRKFPDQIFKVEKP